MQRWKVKNLFIAIFLIAFLKANTASRKKSNLAKKLNEMK